MTGVFRIVLFDVTRSLGAARRGPDASGDDHMGAAVLVYGLLTSFVLSGASRNRRENRPNPRMMEWTGLVMMGVSIGISLILLYHAAMGIEIDLSM